MTEEKCTFSIRTVGDLHLLVDGEGARLRGGLGLLLLVVADAIGGALAVPHCGRARIHNHGLRDGVGLLGDRVCHRCFFSFRGRLK